MSGIIKNVAVIGGGQWGTALSKVIAHNLESITIVDRKQELVDSVNDRHENSVYFPGIKLPDNIVATSDIDLIQDVDLIILAVPSQALGEVVKMIVSHKGACKRFMILSKGIENTTMRLMHEIVQEVMPDALVSVLSGPNFAKYIVQGLPAASVVASEDQVFLADLVDMLNTPNFRCYHTHDMKGVEICGAIKNVIAIAAGICEGHGLGENAKAALITRSLVEVERLVMLFGGEKETVYGLAGIGDLMLTCGTTSSRNYQFGYNIGKHHSMEMALKEAHATVEGYHAAKSVYQIMHSNKVNNRIIDMPICEAVYKILYQNLSVAEALHSLMSRPI